MIIIFISLPSGTSILDNISASVSSGGSAGAGSEDGHRMAEDGLCYSADEFRAHYGEKDWSSHWKRAAVNISVSVLKLLIECVTY